jgi:hypothetical protein
VGVVAAALLLRSDKLLGLLGSASGTSAQWSSGVAVAIGVELHLHGRPTTPAEHPCTSAPILRHL